MSSNRKVIQKNKKQNESPKCVLAMYKVQFIALCMSLICIISFIISIFYYSVKKFKKSKKNTFKVMEEFLFSNYLSHKPQFILGTGH